jgi:hypothetical protein
MLEQIPKTPDFVPVPAGVWRVEAHQLKPLEVANAKPAMLNLIPSRTLLPL